MRIFMKTLAALGAAAGYLLVLRYVAPSDQPYFILGIAVAGLAAWLLGTAAGIAAALLLVPLTGWIYAGFPVSTSYFGLASSPPYLAVLLLAVLGMGLLRRQMRLLARKEADLREANERLRGALARVQEPGGVHSLCSSCKKILDDTGEWKEIDRFLQEQTKFEFSHALCPGCAGRFGQPPPLRPARLVGRHMPDVAP